MKRIFCFIMAGLLIFAGCQKGDVVVEDTGDKTAYALILNNEADADNVNPMVFVQSSKEIAVGDTYESDVFGKLEVLYVYTGFDTDVYLGQDDPRGFIMEAVAPWYIETDYVTSVTVEDTIVPDSTANWFYGFQNCHTFDLEKLDTQNVTNMAYMFHYAGESVKDTVTIKGMDKWDTSKVTDMNNMFCRAAEKSAAWNIGDISVWDTQNVTDMSYMFSHAARFAKEWYVGDLSGWKVDNVTTMKDMFSVAGTAAREWSVGDLSVWNVRNVTDMNSMFYQAGYGTDKWYIGDISTWDTSNVNDMSLMFREAGKYADWNVGDLSKWNVDNVEGYDYFEAKAISLPNF